MGRESGASNDRERALDALRAIALIRVVLWHTYGNAAITYVIAAVPTMFFVTGSLLSASSAARDPHAVEAELRRIVLPGTTTLEVIVNRYGEPSTRSLRRGPGDVDIVGYNHEAVLRPAFPLLPLLSFPRRDPADTFFEVSDGVVMRFWTEM